MHQAFVPKNRKPKFDLTLRIIALNNVPLVAGTSCVKWYIPSSPSAEHRGRTDKAVIKEHKATWDYQKTTQVRLTIDRNGNLQDTEIHFDVLQEYSAHSRGIQLGFVKLNLAEYVNKDDDEDGLGITRRYLMQQSKINSTLRVGISMKQLDGDKNFIAPPLKTAMVFGGIAGIMAGDSGEVDESGHMPSVNNKTRELNESQDMYRRTLAASWACTGGELAPDKLIEDLFTGGDGGIMAPPARPQRRRADDDSDNESRRTVRNLHPDSASTQQPSRKGHGRQDSRGNSMDSSSSPSIISGISGRSSIDQQIKLSNTGRNPGQPRHKELTEFDVRDDLRSWSIDARG